MNLAHIAGVASILAGLGAVIAGLIRGDLAMVTVGAGLLGAPGFSEAVSQKGKKDE